MKNYIKIFCTSLIQVTLVAMNVIFISKGMIIPMLATGFLISLIWTFNIKRIVAGNLKESIVYAFGAMVGTGTGYILAHLLKRVYE